MRNISETLKVVPLLVTNAVATVTGSATDVESYEDDNLVAVTLGTFVSTPTSIITITGSLLATPTVYDQTLATFNTASAGGTGAKRISLAGIKNIKATNTIAGGTNPEVPTSVVLVARPTVGKTGLNSVTIA